MESLVFHLDADKADTNLLDSIKAYFGSRRVTVRVEPDENIETMAIAAPQYVYTLSYLS
jgi:hypothetical protein